MSQIINWYLFNGRYVIGQCQISMRTNQLLLLMPDPQLPAMQNPVWQGKSHPLLQSWINQMLIDCFWRNTILPYQQSPIWCYWWRQIYHYLLAPSRAWYNASCLHLAYPNPPLPAKSVPPLPARLDSPLPGCSQPSQIESFLAAYCKSRFSVTSDTTSTPISTFPAIPVPLLIANPDPLWPAWSQRSQIHRVMLATSKSRPTATSDARSIPPSQALSTLIWFLTEEPDSQLLGSS